MKNKIHPLDIKVNGNTTLKSFLKRNLTKPQFRGYLKAEAHKYRLLANCNNASESIAIAVRYEKEIVELDNKTARKLAKDIRNAAEASKQTTLPF